MAEAFDNDESHIQLVKNIEAQLEKQKISQSRLSRLSDLSPSLVSHVLNLKSTPSLRSLVKLAGALNVSVSDLTKGC